MHLWTMIRHQKANESKGVSQCYEFPRPARPQDCNFGKAKLASGCRGLGCLFWRLPLRALLVRAVAILRRRDRRPEGRLQTLQTTRVVATSCRETSISSRRAAVAR